MRLGAKIRHGRIGLAIAGFLAAVMFAGAAQAHTLHHRRHIIFNPPAGPSTGLGPTAPGYSAILIDATSGAVLSENGADIPRYPASLTKLMTLDLAFQALRDGRMTLDTVLPVSVHAASVEPVKLGLMPGDTISVRQAILAMTTMSANDAATVLGEYLGGGSEMRCAQMMTLRAHALGMAQTAFYNASGLPNPNQVTTARDLSILARDIVVGYPEDQPFFEVQSFDFNGRDVFSNNAMLKIYPGATGMKTGYTILARHNLVTSAVRGGRVLIGVVLHEPNWGQTYQQMTAMLDGGFGGHVDGGNAMMAANAPPPQAALPGPAPASVSASVNAVISPPLPAAQPLPIQMAAQAPRAQFYRTGWTAQFGMYSHMSRARVVAMKAQRLRGVGIARIARVERHGHVLWSAQLAGLSQNAARATCSVFAAKGDSCMIIAPQSDHLAMRDDQNS